MDLRLLRDDEVLAQWILAVDEAGPAIELPVDVGEWNVAPEIRAEVFLPAGARGEIRCEVDLASRTEGFDVDDGFWFNALVEPRAGNLWEGWREFRFPAECFYVRGIPGGWRRPRRVRVTGPAGSRFRTVRLVSRRVAEGPRLTDAALVAAIDVDAPGMEGVRAARDRGDTADALAAFAAVLRRSGRDRATGGPVETPSTRPGGPPLEPTAPNLAEADGILAGRILGQDWSRGIDWNANPLGYIEWSIIIHFLDYLGPLADAWRRTRDERYARGIERIVTDWMRQNPVPFGVRAGGLAWGHSLVAAIRAFGPLLDALDVLQRSPGTADRTLVDLAKSLWEHAEYLLAFTSYPEANKSIAEGRTVAAIGCALPELSAASRWTSRAFAWLLDDLRAQVMADGASHELTTNYQIAVANWFLDAWQVARRHGVALDPAFEAGVRSMYAWCTAVSRPDGTRPSVSDAGSVDLPWGERLAQPARVLGDAAAVWVGTRGREGTVPGVGSVALRDSGYFVMRGGWHPEALHLLFDAGPYGRGHQHEDMLNFDFTALGAPFVVDPGCLSYLRDAWREFYLGTSAHNTVMVDGRPQARAKNQAPGQWVRSARDTTSWRSDDRADVAVGTYDAGYDGVADRVVHRRAVMFVKPSYVAIFDEVSGEGVHACETLFHFMPYRVVIDRSTGTVRTVRQAAPNLEIRPLVRTPVRLVCGQTDPVQGWVSLDRQDVPAPVAIFRRRAPLPQRAGYLLVPFGADRVTAGLDVKLARRGDRWTVDVGLPSGRRDRIVMDWTAPGGPELA